MNGVKLRLKSRGFFVYGSSAAGAPVARVINGTAKVSAEKRARVLEAIFATDFVPDEVARSLYRKSAKLIGLIIPGITNPYFTQAASIIEGLAEENGYGVICAMWATMWLMSRPPSRHWCHERRRHHHRRHQRGHRTLS